VFVIVVELNQFAVFPGMCNREEQSVTS
jgi:hypothetical protein